jgi:hypothetical protein
MLSLVVAGSKKCDICAKPFQEFKVSTLLMSIFR